MSLRPAWAQQDWQGPERFSKPDLTTEEGGLWALMDREETRLGFFQKYQSSVEALAHSARVKS